MNNRTYITKFYKMLERAMNGQGTPLQTPKKKYSVLCRKCGKTVYAHQNYVASHDYIEHKVCPPKPKLLRSY